MFMRWFCVFFVDNFLAEGWEGFVHGGEKQWMRRLSFQAAKL